MRSTVRSSTAFASLNGSYSALKSGLCFSRLKVHTTSAAESVRPEWNFTPSRKWNRVVRSSIFSQRVASLGSSVRSWRKRSSGSKVRCESWSVALANCSWGSSEVGSAS